MKTSILVALSALLFLPVSSSAQSVIPVTYRLTRTAPTPVASGTFLKTAMTCNLTITQPSAAPGLMIDDPVNAGRTCELLGDVGGVILPRASGTTYTYTIAGTVNGTDYGPEGTFQSIAVPNAPTNPRIRPVNVPGVIVQGTVYQRFPFSVNGDIIDVASITVAGQPVHLGAWSLTVPGYSVRIGDVMSVEFWRP